MQRTPTPRADISLSAFLIVVCVVALWESREIPPGTFEPLGSGPVPQATAILIVFLCLIVIVRAIGQLRQPAIINTAEPLVLRTFDTALIAVLTVIYVAILHMRWLEFALLTTCYLVLTIGLLTRFRLSQIPVIVVIALLMGYGCQYLFTQVFVVDLPGVF